MKSWILTLLVVALYVLHQDLWLWDSAAPLIFGFIPIGLFYHVCFSIASSLLMWALVKWAWPPALKGAPDLDTLEAGAQRTATSSSSEGTS
jgi:hypothetical protein